MMSVVINKKVGVTVGVGVAVGVGTTISTQKTLLPAGPIPNRVPSGALSMKSPRYVPGTPGATRGMEASTWAPEATDPLVTGLKSGALIRSP